MNWTTMDGDTGRYFAPDYGTARHRFREFTKRAGASLESLDVDTPGPAGEDLNIDIAWLGSENVLWKDSALIIVHVLNPFGMAWLRRVTFLWYARRHRGRQCNIHISVQS